jgi:hypothetical protein
MVTLLSSLVAGAILSIMSLVFKWYTLYSIMIGNITKCKPVGLQKCACKEMKKYKNDIRHIICTSGLPIYMINRLLLTKFEVTDWWFDSTRVYNNMIHIFPPFTKLLFSFKNIKPKTKEPV